MDGGFVWSPEDVPCQDLLQFYVVHQSTCALRVMVAVARTGVEVPVRVMSNRICALELPTLVCERVQLLVVPRFRFDPVVPLVKVPESSVAFTSYALIMTLGAIQSPWSV